MSAADAFWHVLGLFLPALGTGLIAWSCSAGSLALLGGLVLLGRDGRMASYGAMVAASALALWWAGRPVAGQRPRSE